LPLWSWRSLSLRGASSQAGLDSFNPYLNSSIESLAVQPDGKILISGGFTMVDNYHRTNFARLNPDGRTDTNFVPLGEPRFGPVRGQRRLSIHRH